MNKGTVRELWKISFPLMLSMLSGNFMEFFDRLILARYSLQAMNAVTGVMMVFAIFQYSGITVTSIAEVFVGRANGAKNYKECGPPVWQMLWFSVASFVVFLPLAVWGGFLLPDYHVEAHALPYLRWLALSGPFFLAVAALSSFFVGVGKTKLVMWLTLACNVLNVLLDLLFVFGLSMGTRGAAIATGFSQAVQVAVLLIVFVRHTDYGANLWRVQWPLLKESLRVGVPPAIGFMFEVTAWGLIMRQMMTAGEAYITVLAIGQSFFSLFIFGVQGLERGVSAVAANMIGAGKDALLGKLLRSGFILIGVCGAVLAVPLILYPRPLISLFLNSEEFYGAAQSCLRWVWLYFLLDGAVWMIAGILTAQKDTKFIMWMNAIGIWVVSVLPITIALHYFNAPPTISWMIGNVYAAVNLVAFLYRFRRSETRGSREESGAHSY